jgi:two-component system cell cycle response regulator DivK
MGKRVLVAEDDPMNMKLARDLLTIDGHEVLEATDGAQAVELARRERPDLILMDIQMPEMNGLEAARELRSDEATASIPIVALSSLAMKGDDEKALEAGCDAYITKPVDIDLFRETIARFLKESP